ncbi:hypothetical protein CHS0354_000824 [Potamilus streckersoni]|uniref:Uncharacterized protein n=1 Tax=Potamilus streckersoni TaxID=2493646 RepID=A0AAE0T8E6_9BIVA|nr:hypothetical protein CHS0354_000824 [Potamilus streckersoni]
MKVTVINEEGNYTNWDKNFLEQCKREQYSMNVGTTKLFEDSKVRIWQIYLRPGEEMPFHKHDKDYNWTSLKKGNAVSHYFGGKVAEIEYERGDIVFYNHSENVLCSVSIRPLFSQNPRDTLYLESIALSFHKAAGAVIQALLVEDGVNVKASSAPHALAYEHLATGKVDFVCAAWLPGSHGKYLDSIAKVGQVIEKFSVIYNPYTIWGVPDYIPANEVASVGDLKKPNVAAKMNKLIQGIGAGAGISRFSREIVEKYKLGEWGYHFENGSMEDCVNAFERAYAKKEWVVVPLWHPQYLHSKYKIRELKEPNGLLRVPPPPAAVVATYLPFQKIGNIIMTSFQLPFKNGKLEYAGKLGKEYTTNQGKQIAQLCALNGIAQLKLAANNDLTKIRVVKIDGHVGCVEGFNDIPLVLNGASELINEVFQENGKHARTALGHHVMPLNAPVMLGFTAELLN